MSYYFRDDNWTSPASVSFKKTHGWLNYSTNHDSTHNQTQCWPFMQTLTWAVELHPLLKTPNTESARQRGCWEGRGAALSYTNPSHPAHWSWQKPLQTPLTPSAGHTAALRHTPPSTAGFTHTHTHTIQAYTHTQHTHTHTQHTRTHTHTGRDWGLRRGQD